MNDRDKEELANLVGVLGEAYRQTITPATILAYEIGLDGLAIDDVKRAAAAALRSAKFMPTPAELRQLAGGAVPDDRAVRAWIEFERAVVDHGAYASVRFEDPVTAATVRALGGWQRCCSLPPEEFDKWLRQDFVRTYAALCRTGVGPEAALPLAGIHESNNAGAGFASRLKPPALIRSSLPALPAATAAAPERSPLGRTSRPGIGLEIGRIGRE